MTDAPPPTPTPPRSDPTLSELAERPDRPAWQGLPAGALLGLLGALLGAVIWFAVAYGTGREFGLIAIGLGFLAGGGVLLGNGRPSVPAGAVAAALTLGGVFAAKVLIVWALAGTIAAEEMGDEAFAFTPAEARETVAGDRVFDAEVAAGTPSEAEAAEFYAGAYQEAEAEAAAMSDAEAIAEARRLTLEDLRATRAAAAQGVDLTQTTAAEAAPYYEAERAAIEPMDAAAVDAGLREELRAAVDAEIDPVAVARESLGVRDLIYAAISAFVAFGMAGRESK